MSSWDQPSATWDSSSWDQPPFPPANPKPKHKTMIRQAYFPLRIGNQIVWLRNFKIKLPLHATTLDLAPADVTAILLDVDTAIYGLETYRGALETSPGACYQCIEISLYGDTVPGNVTWLGRMTG